MDFLSQRSIKSAATYIVLILGASLFMLPILWMISTSIKTPRETTRENLRLYPLAPAPTLKSPYIDIRAFGDTNRLAGIPDDVWESIEESVVALIDSRVDEWQRREQALGSLPDSAAWNPEDLRNTMRRGALALLDRRLGDDVRRAANFSAEARGVEMFDSTAIGDASREILQASRGILTDGALDEIFNQAFRRLAVGEVRVRTTDFIAIGLYTGKEWSLLDGQAEIRRVQFGTSTHQHVHYNLPETGAAFRLRFQPRQDTMYEVGDIDRILVNYRGDESWGKTLFFVEKDGTRYRSAPGNALYGRDWVEVELRFPGGEGDAIEQRTYLMLTAVGPATHSDFSVEMEIRSVGVLRAWVSKISRAYVDAFRQVPFARYLSTSFSLALITILLSIFSATIVGYAFARLEWPGRDFFFILLLATMMLPPQVTMIPQFIIMKELGWYNTLVPVWILSGFGIPFFIFLVRQFLKNIPKTLEDAARIDGCGFIRIYWHIMLPLIRPVIITIAIFTFMTTWNNFFAPLIYLNDERLFPVALGLFKFNLSVGQDVSLMMAGAFIATLPSIALFAVLQRYFIEGVTLTGTKE